MTNSTTVEKALSDLALIRKILDEKNRNENIDSKLSGVTLSANLLIQGGAFIFVLILLACELIGGSTMTSIMMMEGHTTELRIFSIFFMGFTILGLLTLLYFILWRAAKHSGEDMSTYIIRNFQYVKNLGLVSDLLMKFIALSIVLLANNPEWISPLLVAFTGDYLLQNRFFTLPTKISSVIGILCIAIGFLLYFTNTESLIVPLAIFTLIAGISWARLLIRYKHINQISSEA